MDELLEQFVIEGRELAQAATDDLLALERNPGDAARIDSAFRAFHTLKGSAGLFDFAPMGEALHAAEDLMSALRAGKLAADRLVLDALLGCISAVEGWIESVAETGALPSAIGAEAQGLSEALRACLGKPVIIAAAPASGWGDNWLPALRARHSAAIRGAVDLPLMALRYVPHADCFFMGDDPMTLVRAVPELVALDITPRTDWAVPFDPFTCNLVIEAVSAAEAATLRDVFRLVSDQVQFAPIAVAESTPVAAAGARSLRIDIARIDAMADIVGELIVANNALAHVAADLVRTHPAAARPLAASQARLDRLVGEMHRAVTTARMTPLNHSLRRLPRQVRELAGRLGKQLNLTISGGETEADKTVVDALFEPLLHVLRNAADHGIEPADARTAAGKPVAGALSLVIGRQADRIMITVRDDGAGIDPSAIRASATARGLLDPGEEVDDARVLDLIFAPGFSTAKSVTETSGRGVGLDAVRASIQALGGSVNIKSEVGRGTSVLLSVPMAAALTSIVLVRAGGERFGVPVEMVAESIRVPADTIHTVQHGRAMVHRGRAIPVLRLVDLLGLQATPARTHRTLLVTEGEPKMAIEVDGFGERSAVVLRPLAGLLAGLRFVLGSVLQGDGSVLLVLSLPEMIG